MPLITGGFHMHQQSEVLNFPADAASEAVTTILRFIGEDPSRDGLLDTPARVLKAWREMTSGYADDPAEILARTFEESSDEMVVLRGISFHSTCEHHMLPFYGEASVGYLPGKVVGISKLARLVDCFARRLQIQERLTRQIAESVEEHLEARGVGVIIRAHHLCMGCRGVRQQTTQMVTSAMLGTLRNDAMARAEFLRLVEGRWISSQELRSTKSPTAACWAARSTAKRWCSFAGELRSSRSAEVARTTTRRSLTASCPATRFAVRGITPVSICGPAPRWRRR